MKSQYTLKIREMFKLIERSKGVTEMTHVAFDCVSLSVRYSDFYKFTLICNALKVYWNC